MEKEHRALKPDAQGFDEIRFVTIPRYKTSALSGNEWRVHVQMEFYRNGIKVHEEFGGHDMEKAMQFAAYRYSVAGDDGHAYFAGEDDFCDQEGCSNKATVTYKLKKLFCVGGGNCGQEKHKYHDEIRMFCEEHKTRGNSDLEDADSNYEVV